MSRKAFLKLNGFIMTVWFRGRGRKAIRDESLNTNKRNGTVTASCVESRFDRGIPKTR